MKTKNTVRYAALALLLLGLFAGVPDATAQCQPNTSTGVTVDVFRSDRQPPIHGTVWQAQTFTVLGSGCLVLDQLTVSVLRLVDRSGNSPADLVLEIYNVTGTGFPPWPAALGGTATPLATATVASSVVPTTAYTDITFAFSPPPQLAGGAQYAAVFHQLGNAGTGQLAYRLGLAPGNVYAGGGYYKYDPTEASKWAFPHGPEGGLDVRMSICVSPCVAGCVRTQGYWKTHGGRGPQPNVWPVNSLTLGGFSYTQSELLDILEQQVVGNGLISLAHQLIAAKLNIASGASAPSAILAAINSADALMATTFRVPPIGNGFLDPSVTAALTQTLDQYNNGVFVGGPPHCE